MNATLRLPLMAAMVAVLGTTLPLAARADHRLSYEVTITNITYNQRFTPLLLASHEPSVTLFQLGAPSSAELKVLAEEGNVAPQKAVLDASKAVRATAAGNGLLDPGKSLSFRIEANPWRDRLSVAAMLIPTNDAFMALNAVSFPYPGSGTLRYQAIAYDAGTEINDELCTSIPGPFFVECSGPGGGAGVGGGEGFVHVHRGVHGVGNLRAADRDWRNPVAQVTIRQVR